MITTIGLFLLWQLCALWGVLRLVRFASEREPALPRVPRVPREFATGEWTPGRGAPTPAGLDGAVEG
jgi:hypothetical protein